MSFGYVQNTFNFTSMNILVLDGLNIQKFRVFKGMAAQGSLEKREKNRNIKSRSNFKNKTFSPMKNKCRATFKKWGAILLFTCLKFRRFIFISPSIGKNYKFYNLDLYPRATLTTKFLKNQLLNIWSFWLLWHKNRSFWRSMGWGGIPLWDLSQWDTIWVSVYFEQKPN